MRPINGLLAASGFLVIACSSAGPSPNPAQVVGTVVGIERGTAQLSVAYGRSWIDDGDERSVRVSEAGGFALPSDAKAAIIYVDLDGDDRVDLWDEPSTPCFLEEEWRCDLPGDRIVIRDWADGDAPIQRDYFSGAPNLVVEVCSPGGVDCSPAEGDRRGRFLYVASCDPDADVELWLTDGEARMHVDAVPQGPLVALAIAREPSRAGETISVEMNVAVQRARLSLGAREHPSWSSEMVIEGSEIHAVAPAAEIERCERDVDCEIWIQAATLGRAYENRGLFVDHVREVYIPVSSKERAR